MADVNKSKAASVKNEYLEEIRKAYREINPPKDDRDAVWEVFQVLVEQGYRVDKVNHVIKQETGKGFSIKKFKELKGEAPPGKVVKKLERRITREIAKEATAKIGQVLETGKTLEDNLRPIAHFYGFESVSSFVGHIYFFWDTWKDHVPQLVEKNKLLEEGMKRLVHVFSPEVKKAMAKQSIKDLPISLGLMGSLGGHFPPPETMLEYIRILKEEMMA